MIQPIIDVPTTSNKPDIENNARFDEPLGVNSNALVNKHGKFHIAQFIQDYKDLTLTQEDKDELINAVNKEIDWVKKKLDHKLRKPMWQDENNPRSKEKLIRMFNKYVKKRLDLIECLESE